MSPDDHLASGSLDPDDPDSLSVERERFAGEVLEVVEVLGLFERHAPSSLGRRMLQELAPLPDLEVRSALERLREMQLLFKAGDRPGFAGVVDPLPRAIAGARLFEEDRLLALRGFLDASARMRAWFGERSDDVPSLAEVARALPDLERLRSAIDSVLDHRGRVRDDASGGLARLRRLTGQLAEEVEQGLKRVLNRGEVRAVLSDATVHRRGGRPVLAVRAKSAGRVRGLVHDRSSSGESVFIEPEEVVEVGNRLAEARTDERREVERILLDLSATVREEVPRIHQAADGVGRIELAFLSASFCEEHGARPALQPGDDGAAEGLLLRSARHPLLMEQVTRGELTEVVPIDLRLGGEFDLLIVTGPNTGGKTLAMKTAGLFALLTRLGLPVPGADGTTVPLYDRICADIGDEQEIRQNLSTFASHLVRIRAALEDAGSETLVLIDELGGGTDPEEGAALGEAVLEDLLRRSVPTIVSTHIGKLKEFAYRRPRAENASTEFDAETMRPRYQLLIGTPGESCAIIIARRLGLPQRITDMAAHRRERREGEVAELMEDVRLARLEAERLRAEAEQRVEEAAARLRDLDDRRAEIDRRSEQLEAEAQKGIEERVRDAAKQLERARALLSQLPKESGGAMREVLDRLEADLTGASLTDRRQAFLDGLGKGSLVYLPRYRQRVIVHKLDKARREVTCKLGSMKVQVSFDEVTPYESL